MRHDWQRLCGPLGWSQLRASVCHGCGAQSRMLRVPGDVYWQYRALGAYYWHAFSVAPARCETARAVREAKRREETGASFIDFAAL